MKVHHIRYIFLAMSACSGFVSAAEPPREGAEHVSIIQLIATPEKYEGKLVTIQGFVRLEFEGNAIYLHRDDYEQGLSSNGLWLNANECKRIDGKDFDTGYALVTGRFTSTGRGHMGLWAGEIQDVSDCSSWPPGKAGI